MGDGHQDDGGDGEGGVAQQLPGLAEEVVVPGDVPSADNLTRHGHYAHSQVRHGQRHHQPH